MKVGISGSPVQEVFPECTGLKLKWLICGNYLAILLPMKSKGDWANILFAKEYPSSVGIGHSRAFQYSRSFSINPMGLPTYAQQ